MLATLRERMTALKEELKGIVAASSGGDPVLIAEGSEERERDDEHGLDEDGLLAEGGGGAAALGGGGRGGGRLHSAAERAVRQEMREVRGCEVIWTQRFQHSRIV